MSGELNSSEIETIKKEKIFEVIRKLKEGITNEIISTNKNIKKLKEELIKENEKYQLISKIVEKTENKKAISDYTIHNLVDYKFDNNVFEYVKEFTQISNSIELHDFLGGVSLYFKLEIPLEKSLTFAKITLEYPPSNKQEVLLNNRTDIKETYDNILASLFEIVLNAEIKYNS